jgi:integrating conjugative element protein (TIGR03752 family)
MKSNSLLWVGGALVVFFALALLLWPKNKTAQNKPGDDLSVTISAQDAKLLGIEGDTPRDTLATIVGQMKAVKFEIEAVKKQNDTLATENERLRGREANVDARLDARFDQAVRKAQEEIDKAKEGARKSVDFGKSQIGELKDRFTQLGPETPKEDEDLPVGLGLQPGDGKAFNFNSPFDALSNLSFGRGRQASDNRSATATGRAGGAASATTGQEFGSFGSSLVWVEPSDGIAMDPKTNKPKSEISFPNVFSEGPLGELSSSQKRYREVAKGEKDLDKRKRSEGTKEHYTIAENSTLMGSKVMTALIGRVPIDGTVNDPYPFKVLIGKENLAANGIDLPDVSGAVMTGMATGDWTLSCVRGQIESITFVFDDGTIRTVPEPEATVKRGQSISSTASLNNIRGGLGYISDPQGIPCIAGLQRSNAQEYLTTQTLVTAAGAAIAATFAKDGASVGNVASGGYIMSDRNQALNTILAGGVRDISTWVNKLYGQAFAAIYVPPHAEIAVHIDREISIDYEPHGRKVNYHADNKTTTDLD